MLQVKDWKSRSDVFQALNEVMYLKKHPTESTVVFVKRARLVLEEKYKCFPELDLYVDYHRKHYASPKRLGMYLFGTWDILGLYSKTPLSGRS